MVTDKRFLVNVGISDLLYPIHVISKYDHEGQATVANISINARIMQEFQARWIDKFMQIVHDHKGRIGTKTLKVNILDYLQQLNATQVQITFDYPFFLEKTTPVSKASNLMCHQCRYSVAISAVNKTPLIRFGVKVPIVTTYPASSVQVPGGLFGQLSVVDLEVETSEDIYPEDLIEMIDRHALASVYSFLSQEDQDFLIQKIHTEEKASVIVIDEIKEELARHKEIENYSIRCSNQPMLRPYSTMIITGKNRWVPFSSYESE